jgi:hypothetical protein
MASKEKFVPVAVLSSFTVAPCLRAISALLTPQMPLLQISTVLPGSSMLFITHSMAACPVAERAKVVVFLVWKMYCTPALMSSMTLQNSGCKWPIVGKDWALRTLSLQLEGPGPVIVFRGMVSG